MLALVNVFSAFLFFFVCINLAAKKVMYRALQNFIDGETENKNNEEKVVSDVNVDKARYGGGADLSYFSNNDASYFGRSENVNGHWRGYNALKRIRAYGNNGIHKAQSFIDKKIYGFVEADRIPSEKMNQWERAHDNRNREFRGRLENLRGGFMKPTVQAYEKFMDAKLIREGAFPFRSINHAIATYDIGRGINASNNLSSTAQRFAAEYDSLYNGKNNKVGKIEQGSNAIRHTFWQSALSSKYGPQVARDAGDSHETRPYTDVDVRVFDNIEDADMVADLLNNKIGRKIGAQYPDCNRTELALRVLDEYRRAGLYSYEQMPDGKWYVVKKVIPDDAYYELYNKYRSMNEYGRKD